MSRTHGSGADTKKKAGGGAVDVEVMISSPRFLVVAVGTQGTFSPSGPRQEIKT